MAETGKYANLRVMREVDFGLYLDGENLGDILLPIKEAPPGTKPEDVIEVFIYRDSEDRIIATSREPYAIVDEFAVLQVASVDKVGAWLDWGLIKHLLVPFREQKQDMEEAKSYLVYVYLDKDSDRIVASSKLDKFLDNVPPEYEEGQEVDVLITNKSDIGYNAVINNLHTGLIYANEVFQKLNRGQRLKAYVKKVREDDKIDITLQKLGYEHIDEFTKKIVDSLNQNNGEMELTDKSSPDDIYKLLEMSKKNFKKAVGSLYKARQITIENDRIKLA